MKRAEAKRRQNKAKQIVCELTGFSLLLSFFSFFSAGSLGGNVPAAYVQ
jgi:uncharacterized membrane protein